MAIRAIGKPFVIAGDFNMEPHGLQRSGFLERVGGRVVSPTDGAIRPSGRVIDYFVISHVISEAHAEIKLGWDIAPRFPVELKFNASSVN
eukprot:4387225-Pyramimonas_sp.AAC.1